MLVGLAALPGCAVDYIDADGVRHVIGLAAVTIPPPAKMGPACLRGASVQAVGVIAYDNGAGSGFGVGYVDEGVTTAFECGAVVGDVPK